MSLRRLFVCGLLAAAGAVQAQAPARVAVDDFRVLLVQAIDSPNGQAQGMFVGKMAEAIAQRLPGSGPILIDVTTLKRYKQEGCRRLNMRFSQQGVKLPGEAAPKNETLDMGINYCRDGKPPKSLQ
jgi:hypothetical protein